MSISSEITRINQNIASAYTACNNKGATMPQTQNSANLAATITSITTGGGVTNAKCFPKTIAEDVIGGNGEFNPEGDADIKAHRNDSTFVVGFIATFPVSNKSVRASFVGAYNLHNTNNAYGVYLRSSSAGLAGGFVQKYAKDPPNTTSGTISVDSNGVVSAFGSSDYPLRAGTYIIIAGW